MSPDRMYPAYSEDFYNQIEEEIKALPKKRCTCKNVRDFTLEKKGNRILIFCDTCHKLWGTARIKDSGGFK